MIISVNLSELDTLHSRLNTRSGDVRYAVSRIQGALGQLVLHTDDPGVRDVPNLLGSTAARTSAAADRLNARAGQVAQFRDRVSALDRGPRLRGVALTISRFRARLRTTAVTRARRSIDSVKDTLSKLSRVSGAALGLAVGVAAPRLSLMRIAKKLGSGVTHQVSEALSAGSQRVAALAARVRKWRNDGQKKLQQAFDEAWIVFQRTISSMRTVAGTVISTSARTVKTVARTAGHVAWVSAQLAVRKATAIADSPTYKTLKATHDSAKFGVWAIKNGKVLGNIDADARHIFHYSATANSFADTNRFAPLTKLGTFTKAANLGLSVVEVGKSSFDLGNDLANHHYGDATRNGIEVTWTLAGTAYPPVGWAKAAWDTGYFVGTEIAVLQEHVFHTQDNTVNYAATTYGTDHIGTRYDGWSGFGNFALDSMRLKNPFASKVGSGR